MDERKLRSFIRKHLNETSLNEVTPADFQTNFNAATTVDAETIKQSLMALSMFISIPAIKIAADKLLSSWSDIKKDLSKEKSNVDDVNKQENEMKLSETRLRQIVREEMLRENKRVISEMVDPLTIVAGLATAATAAHISYDYFLEFLNRYRTPQEAAANFEREFGIPADV